MRKEGEIGGAVPGPRLPRGVAAALAFAAALAVSVAAATAVFAQDEQRTVYGCYDKQGGALRVVGGPKKDCKQGERKISWNKKGPAGPAGAKGETGPAGPRGEAGPKGEPGAPGQDGTNGAPGKDGEDGATGKDGRSLLSGADAPAEGLGNEGDFYIDTRKDEIYGPKTQGSWGQPTSLTGPAGKDGTNGQDGANGEDGTDGKDGADGNTVLSGTVEPAGELGSEGDFYIDTEKDEMYGPKTTGGWGDPTPLAGPEGPRGEKGLNWRGAWDSTGTYAAGDAVSHEGSSWFAKRENTNATPAEGDDWTLLAEKGEPGADGSSDGTPENTPNTNVARDANGGFQAGAVGVNGKLTQNSKDGLVSSGTFGQGTIPAEGAGERMMWYPGKAAFRAGSTYGSEWNDSNIGVGSTAMGRATTASGEGSTAMGLGPTASGEYSIAMGYDPRASGYGSIAMGYDPRASGYGSIAIGERSSASGTNSVAIGEFATTYECGAADGSGQCADNRKGTVRHGSVVISDGSGRFSTDAVYPTADNQIAMRGSGGFRLYTNTDKTTGVGLAPSGTSWQTISDRNKKENFRPVDGSAILSRVVSLPITNWNYIGADPNRRYIGPTAQDFQAAFGLGEDTTITTQDMDGVTLAAVQELGKENEKLKERDEELEEENASLKEAVEKLKEETEKLKEEKEASQEEEEETKERQDELEERLAELEKKLEE